MPIPVDRKHLEELIVSSFKKLNYELDSAAPDVGSSICVDDWSVKDVLAVRAWWTKAVIDWIEAGQRGETPITPAVDYKWNETPRLNTDIIHASADESFESIRKRLIIGYERVLNKIGELNDRHLFEVRAFEWAGKWPISRWISINTARQYTTAASYVKKARHVDPEQKRAKR